MALKLWRLASMWGRVPMPMSKEMEVDEIQRLELKSEKKSAWSEKKMV